MRDVGEEIDSIRVPAWCQGPTGSGQGGWTSARLAALTPQPLSIAIRAPIPLETDLAVIADDEGYRALDTTGAEPVTIL